MAEGYLSVRQAFALTLIGSHADYDTGANAYPGRRHLIQVGGFSPKTLQRSIERGRELRLIEPTGTKRRKGGDLTVYRLTMPNPLPETVAARLGGASPAELYDTRPVTPAIDPVPLRGVPGEAVDPVPLRGVPGGPIDPVPFRAEPGSLSAEPGSPQRGTRTPNPEGVVVGVADAGSASASPAAPHDQDNARAWLQELATTQAPPYDRLGATACAPLLGHAERLANTGWPPAVVGALLTGLPPERSIRSSADALVANRLASISGAPNVDLIDDAATLAAIIAARLVDAEPHAVAMVLQRAGANMNGTAVALCLDEAKHGGDVPHWVRAILAHRSTDVLRATHRALPSILDVARLGPPTPGANLDDY